MARKLQKQLNMRKFLKRRKGPQITHEFWVFGIDFPGRMTGFPPFRQYRARAHATHTRATIALPKIIKWIKSSASNRNLTVVALNFACKLEIGCSSKVSGRKRIVAVLFSVSFSLITNRYIREYKLSSMNVIFSRLL